MIHVAQTEPVLFTQLTNFGNISHAMCFESNVRTSLVLFWQVSKRVYQNNATTLVSRSVIEYSILDIQYK